MNKSINAIQIIPVLAGKKMPAETVASVVEAFAKFSDFAQHHATLLVGLAETWSDEERAYRVGFSVEFRSQKSNDPVVLHVTNEGGIVMCRFDSRLRLTEGSLDSDEIVAFLHPDWTEFEVRELGTYEFLIQAMTKWEETGTIPVEFLR